MPTGAAGRAPSRRATLPSAWSLFQLWYASPLPFTFNVLVLNYTEMRSLHLGFALFLAFLAFPFAKRRRATASRVQDWVLAAVAGVLRRVPVPVLPRDLDASRPADPARHRRRGGRHACCCSRRRGASSARRWRSSPSLMLGLRLRRPVPARRDRAQGRRRCPRRSSHFWLTTEGVFGVALGVSASFIFLFVLFGSLLEKAGAGNYFIQVAFALLGHLRGGPAKAAVVSSGMMGMISGSSVANVVTCGTFTIPLMKRVGYSAEKAGAIEVAAGVDGQIMPPVMGAAAFLMAEYVGVPYAEIVQARVPAGDHLLRRALLHRRPRGRARPASPASRAAAGVSPMAPAARASLMTLAGIVIVAQRRLLRASAGSRPLLGDGALWLHPGAARGRLPARCVRQVARRARSRRSTTPTRRCSSCRR